MFEGDGSEFSIFSHKGMSLKRGLYECTEDLGWEDPLEKSMATHSSILAWRIPWTEEPGGLQSKGSQESDMKE